jgi:rhodanese-related sulfurtransferase
VSFSYNIKAVLVQLLFATSIVCFTGCAAKQALPAPPVPTPPMAAPIIMHANPEQAAKMVSEGKVLVLDIRTPAEYQAQRIAGATNLDFRAPDFEQRLGTLDRNATYLLHCASGGRSTRSLPVFEKLGFQFVTHLDGGIKAWIAAGKPTETGDSR